MGYFDGATQGNMRICEAGGYLYLLNTHCFSFKARLGEGTNNFDELSAIILILRLAMEHGDRKLYIFGDPQIIIKSIIGHNQMQNISAIVTFGRGL